MPADGVEGMVVGVIHESIAGKIGPVAAGEAELIGDDAAEGAGANIDAPPEPHTQKHNSSCVVYVLLCLD